MLGKLIKHEFRATSLFCGLLFAGLIALAALSRLFMLLERQLQLFSLPLGSHSDYIVYSRLRR